MVNALYVHVPFCLSKCFYCNFNSFADVENLMELYLAALLREIKDGIKSAADINDNSITSIYFGGGTPSILEPSQLASIINTIRENIKVAQDCEITIEANPGTLDKYKLKGIKSINFNRLSIGVQSFDDNLLKSIGRIHTSKEAKDVYADAREIGFKNVSIDLIYALPQQSIDLWRDTIKKAIDLNPEHISLYELSIEEGTRYNDLLNCNVISLPEQDMQIEMYETAIEMLTETGYEHYEVSNFAKSGFRSRHNQVYWNNQSYFGYGAGASSYIDGIRSTRIASPEEYILRQTGGQDVVEYSECMKGEKLCTESMMLGLRMTEGIDLTKLKVQTGIDVTSHYEQQLKKLVSDGLLIFAENQLYTTHKGRLLLNDVIMQFM